jgi:hypothetical protein
MEAVYNLYRDRYLEENSLLAIYERNGKAISDRVGGKLHP